MLANEKKLGRGFQLGQKGEFRQPRSREEHSLKHPRVGFEFFVVWEADVNFWSDWVRACQAG